MAENTTISVEDAFFAYAKGRIAIPQKMLTEFLMKAAEYCHLKVSILGMTDITAIRSIQQKVSSGRLLRFRYGKDTQQIREVVQLYYSFVKSFQQNQVYPTMEEEKLPSQKQVPQNADERLTIGSYGTPTPARMEASESIELKKESPRAVEVQAEPAQSETDSSHDIEQVDFSRDSAFEYTKPVAYTYRGVRHEAKAWNSLYVELCGLLFADHHDAFMSVMNADVPGYGTLAFADEEHKTGMRYPRSFAPGYYVEANSSATHLVRRIRGLYSLMKLNGQLQILYQRTDSARRAIIPTNKPDNTTEAQMHHGSSMDVQGNSILDSFRYFLLAKQNLAERTAGNYCTSIRMIEEYIRRHNLGGSLFSTDANCVKNLICMLMARPDFVRINDNRHHQFSAAMSQYLLYLLSYQKKQDNGEQQNELTIIEAVFVVLRNSATPINMAQIHQQILARHLYRFNTDNSMGMVRHAVWTHIQTNKDRIERGEDVIIQTSNNALNQYQLMTADKASIFLYGKTRMPSTTREIVLPEPEARDQELIQRAESAVLVADLSGLTVEDLADKLGAAVWPVKKAAQESMSLVMIYGRLIHKDSFVDWDDGADRLEAILDKLMNKNNGYVSDAQLYEYARNEMQMFLNDNDLDDQRKVFDLAEHLFGKEGYHGKRYSFLMKTHISRESETITSKLDLIRKYARDNGGCFHESDLEIYLHGLGVKTANLRQQMKVYDEPIFLFYALGTFITAESMQIDDIWIAKAKSALQKLFDDTGDHVVLRDIQPWWFTLLPELPGGRQWTALLLQSVLFHYGKQVGAKTIYGLSGQTGDTLNAMVVSLESEIRTFADAVVSVLLEDHIAQREFEAEELRQLLVRRGLIAGNELIWNMPKAIPTDERFIWDAEGQNVTINL